MLGVGTHKSEDHFCGGYGYISIGMDGFWVQGVVMLEVEVGAELRLKAGIRFGNG